MSIKTGGLNGNNFVLKDVSNYHMARPTKNNPAGAQKSPKLTPETISKLEQAFAIDATIAEACFYADISHDTYHRWVKDNPKLSDKFARLREKPVLTARQTVVKNLDKPDMALKYLERKRKNEFSLRVEQTGADGKDLPQPIINVSRDNGHAEDNGPEKQD